MSILTITTGGTIGSVAYPDPTKPPQFSTMPPSGQDVVRDALTQSFAAYACDCLSLEPRDSKDAYVDDLAAILAKVATHKILITHGTDRILQSADALFHRQAASPALSVKSIVLVGAMIPLANGALSDGYQNMEFALQQLSAPDFPAGVFIVLSDYENPEAETGAWKPKLYAYQPNTFQKIHASDARYSRLRKA